MRIFGKMLLTFMIVIVLFISLNIYTLLQTNDLKNNSEQIYEQGIEPNMLLINLAKLAENTRVQMVTALALKNPETAKSALANLEEMSHIQLQLSEQKLASEVQQALSIFSEKWRLFDEQVRANEQLIAQNNWPAATVGIQAGKPLFEDAMSAFEDATVVNTTTTESLAKQNEQDYERAFTVFATLASLITVVSLLTAYLFTRNMTKRLHQLAQQTTRLANGELTAEFIPVTTKDEISQTAEGINQMQKSLKHIVSEANDTSQQVAASAQQMSTTTEEHLQTADSITSMSQDADYNAAAQQQNVRETTDSLANINGSVEQIPQNDEHLHDLSNNTFKKNQYGAITVENVHTQIHSTAESSIETERSVLNVNSKSQEIGNIVNMITQIAEQTNLLALNAAIEATRAGDNGLGFAVVADEVRKLAEQSKGSSEQINEMITEIQLDITKVIASIQDEVARVKIGLEQSKEVQEVFTEIDLVVKDVKENTQGIHHSIQKISTLGLLISSKTDEVNELALKTLEAAQVTADSSKGQLGSFQDITTASESLASLSVQLQTVISHFKL